LGDTIEKVTEATGIKAAVKAVVGDDMVEMEKMLRNCTKEKTYAQEKQ